MDEKTNYKKIVDKGKKYALVISGSDLPEGLKFYTEDKEFIQVASWKYNKGHKTKPHSHKICKRSSDITQEFIFVKKGCIEVTIYNDEDKVIAQQVLKQGDCILTFLGGHKYRILEDETEIFEIKNGPYPGLDKDKKVINDD